MPRLAFQQAEIELAQLRIQVRHQRLEALAAARLDKGANHQGIDQLDRLMGTHHRAQTRRIAPGRQGPQGNLAALHQAHHLLVMHQLFTSQTRHQVDQVDMGVVLGHQAQRGAGGFELTVLVVKQQRLQVGQGRLHPAIGRLAAKEFSNFRKQHSGLAAVIKAAHYTLRIGDDCCQSAELRLTYINPDAIESN